MIRSELGGAMVRNDDRVFVRGPTERPQGYALQPQHELKPTGPGRQSFAAAASGALDDACESGRGCRLPNPMAWRYVGPAMAAPRFRIVREG